MSVFNKGDIVEINLGEPPQEIKGHEQGYTRPCMIVKSFNNLQLAIIVPFTTKVPKYSLYSHVKILKGIGGLSEDSYALCHQIRVISFDRIGRKRGKLDNKNILKIHSVLIDTLEL